MTNQKLTKKTTEFRKWKEIAKQTRKAQQEAVKLGMMMTSVPKTVQRRGYDKVYGGLTDLQSDLEERMFLEHPTRATTNVFYGKNQITPPKSEIKLRRQICITKVQILQEAVLQNESK